MDPGPEYARWYQQAARLCLDAIAPHGIAIFCQTDRRGSGRWHSKSAPLFGLGARCLWHKIVLRRAPGATDLFRPTYSHLLAFSPKGKVGPATPDVIEGGPPLWEKGMGTLAASFAAAQASRFGPRLLAPFCGYGTALAAGLPYFRRMKGIDNDPAMLEQARRLLAGFSR